MDINLKHTKAGYGEALLELGEKDENLVVLGGDITESTNVHLFRDKFPQRFFSTGIAEQNMAATAAGLSLMGKIPFICSYGVFISGRCWDQIRTTICYSNLNVKIGVGHGGISVGPDGATHQALEDISLLRCLPNMTVLTPSDYLETKKATLAAYRLNGPCSIRFGREPTPQFTQKDDPFEIGKANTLKPGTDAFIIACGSMVYQALQASERLSEEKGFKVGVINLHTIKPLDRHTIVAAAKQSGALVTAEEHQLAGGMGSAVLEVLAGYPVPVEMVGVKDSFGESGHPDELLRAYNLTCPDIITAVEKVIAIKKKTGLICKETD